MLRVTSVALALAVTASLTAVLPADARKPNPAKTVAFPALAEPSPLDGQLAELHQAAQTAQWHWRPAHADTITLDHVIETAVTNHPLVVEADARLAETRAKEDEVDGKRVLFFFKYIEARYLEGSAELDVDSAEAQVEAARQNALKQTLGQYADWVKASAASAAAFGQQQTASAEALYAARQFEQGEITGLQLNHANGELLMRSAEASKRLLQRQQACIPLQALLDANDVDEVCVFDRPIGLITPADEPELNENDRQALTEGLAGILPRHFPLDHWVVVVPDDATKVALANRPDLQALKYREAALESLVKASAIQGTLQFTQAQTHVIEATLASTKKRRRLLETQIVAEMENARQSLAAAESALALAQTQRYIAARGWHQARVGVATGVLSEREALAVEAAYLQAQAAQIIATMDVLTAKVAVQHTLGTLTSADVLAALEP